MNDQILTLGNMENKLRNVKTLSLIGLILSGVYFVIGLASLILSLIPVPFPFSLIALPLFIVLNVLEFCCMVGSFTINGLTLGKLFGIKKELAQNPENPENSGLALEIKPAWIFSIIGISVTGGCCVLYTLLLIVEILLSVIV